MDSEIILHCFQWRLKDITKELDNIKSSGFTSIQISPVQGCKDDGNEFWKLYQPLGMRVIESSQIGTKDDLIELCTKAKKMNIKIIADVVLRHTAGVNTGELTPHELVDKELMNNSKFWTNAQNTYDYHNRWSSTNMAFGMPMLNYNNTELQQIYIKFLQELKDCGVNGFRVDMGKHFSLPEEGSNFWTNVFDRFSDMFNYAECLESDKKLLDKYTKYINVLTDSTASDKRKMVIFIESHDTYHTFHITNKMNNEQLLNEYEWMMKNNRESHILFFARPFDNTYKCDRIKYIHNNYR